MSERLSVLIPVYNDARSLEASVHTLVGHLRERGHDFELIIVDDASTDDTFAVVQDLARRYPFTKFLQHDINMGPCSGLKTGPPLAVGEWLLLLPADLAIPLEDIELLWRNRSRSDIVLGYMIDPNARPLRRRLQSAVYTGLINRLFDLDLRQVNYVALYRAEVFRRISLNSSGVALHAEILVRARCAGLRIRQVGLGHLPRRMGSESGSNPRVILKTLAEILHLALELRR